MPPKGPGSLPRLFAHDDALNPTFGRNSRDHGVGRDVLDVKDNKAAVVTPADSFPDVVEAHKKAWEAFDRQDFDGAVEWFQRAVQNARKHGCVAYKSENTLGLVFTAMADFDAALRQTSRLKRLLDDAPESLRPRFRMALHTNRGAVFSRIASREPDAVRAERFLHMSYREHQRAAAICLEANGTLDTERSWNLADAACRLGCYEETAKVLGDYLLRNPHLGELIHINSRQDDWAAFLSLYHEHAGKFVRARPEKYREGENRN